MSEQKQKARIVLQRKVDRRVGRDRRKGNRREAEIVVYLTPEEIAVLLAPH